MPGNAKHLVLKYLRKGVIDINHIENVDMLILARQYLRAKRLASWESIRSRSKSAGGVRLVVTEPPTPKGAR